MYRFYNSSTGAYLLTPSTTERDAYISNPRGYVYQGVAFAVDTSNVANNAPLYKFTNLVRGTYFYTANPAERDGIITSLSASYRYDGVVFNVSSNATGGTPVYRFFFKNNGTHFYTTSETEKTSLQANANYTYEGVGFYIAVGAAPADTTKPVGLDHLAERRRDRHRPGRACRERL